MRNFKKFLVGILVASTILPQIVSAETNDEYDRFETISNYAANLYIDEEKTATEIMDSAVKEVIKGNPELMNELIKAGLKSLDEYTEYYTAEEYEQFKKNLNHIVYGIGVLIQQKNDYITVTSVLEGGSASEAGVMSGDKITKVNGQDVKGASVDKVQDLVVGELNTDVTVTFLREGKEFTCTMKRGEVKGTTVSQLILEGNIGYISILNFAQNTTQEFFDALKKFDEAGVTKIILDLRDNPGGYLQSAVDIASVLVPKGIIVSTIYRSEWENEIFYSNLDKTKYDLAVLVNENTASAAEVLASAISDSKAGILIGTMTYGKGVIQQMYNLWDGCAFKITTGRYFTRNGKDINGEGIEPQEFVNNTTRRIDLTRYETFDYKTKPSVGVTSANVKAAKQRLKIMGYYQGEINDTFDSGFFNAVYDFQAENELFPYGVLDISTQVKMENIFYKIPEEVDNQLIFAYEHFGGTEENLYKKAN